MKITDKLVQRLMIKWWVRLGLEDWRIQWQWNTQDEIEAEQYNASAYTTRWADERAAQIHISSERKWEYPGTANLDDDLERVILHELTHVYFMPQDQPLHTANDMVKNYLPKDVWKHHWDLLVASREGYVQSFVELLLRQDRGKK